MSRITRKQADEMAKILCNTLCLPCEPYAQDESGSYKAQIGCIHINSQNGTNNIYQINNESGGCKGLAYGLTLKECYLWLSAAVEGARLVLNSEHRGI